MEVDAREANGAGSHTQSSEVVQKHHRVQASSSDDDPFDTLLSLEDQYYQEGYNLGVADGSKAGRVEGRVFGLEKGFEKYAQMGQLSGKAKVWQARVAATPPSEGKAEVGQAVVDGMNESTAESGGGRKVAGLGGNHRLRKHIDRLVELTDSESLETKNSEEAVNEFDERLAGANSKVTLISRITGEGEGDPRPATAVGEGQEVEIGRSGKPKKGGGEMEDFVGLPTKMG